MTAFRMMRTYWPVALLACAVAAAAQDAASSPANVPMLRSTTRDVLLDVIVTDRNGHTVRNLSPQDFVVKEDGVQQKSHVIEAPGDTVAGTHVTGQTAAAAAGDAAGSAAVVDQRQRTLILLDQVNVKFFDLAFARMRLDVFLASDKAPGQTIGILALTNNKLVLVHDFTTDRAALRKALHDLPPATPATANAVVDEYQDFENFTHAISALETIGRSLQGAKVRTNCIWITSGFLTMAKMVNSPEVEENFDAIMRHTANLYLGARMSVYTIDPHGVQFESSLPNHDAQPRALAAGGQVSDIDNGTEIARQMTNMTSESAVINTFLGKLDERTGGRGYGNQNDIDVPLGQALDDASSSFLLSYTPSNRDFHGEYRKVHVEMRTPGLRARTRDGYIAAGDTRDSTPEELRKQLQHALESPLPYTALHTTATLEQKGVRPVLHVQLEPDGVEWLPSGNGAGGGQVAQIIAVAAYSASGKPLYNREYRVTTARPDLQSRNNLNYALALGVPPATSRLRVAVMDEHGSRLGTTEIAVQGRTGPANPAP